MKLIFDWSSSFYEEKTRWRSDEEILSLEIFQKECGFAVARVSIGVLNAKKLINKRYAKIGIQTPEKVELIFTGRLVTFPVGFGNSTTELELIAEPQDYHNKLSKFYDENLNRYRSVDKHAAEETDIIFDDLFFSPRDYENPTIFLEGNNNVFYWNMRNGELSLSNVNRGRKNFNVGGNEILQDSMKVRIAREPYKVVNLKVSASWIQYEYGAIDVAPMISQKFNLGLINSFTNIKSAIENMQTFSHKTGYELTHCDIKEINPNISMGFGGYPILSPEFYTQENESAERKKVLFKRFYFDGKLLINWTYKQKRTEIANIKIFNESSPHGREKNLYFRLNAVQLPKKYPLWKNFTYYGCGDKIQYGDGIFECRSPHISKENFEAEDWNLIQKIPDALKNDASSSFFATTRGKNAIRYALQRAVALINYSSRRVEIDFCVEAKKFMSATVDDQITIVDERFHGGRICGKIIKTRFMGNANQKIIKFTVGCRLQDLSDGFEKLASYKIEVPDDDSKIHPADIVKNIEIKNPPEEQLEILSQTTAKNAAALQQELKKHGTKIKISLHPLSTTRVIVREIALPNLKFGEIS